MLETGAPLFVDGGGQHQAVAADATAGEGDECRAPTGDVVEHPTAGEGEQALIDLFARQAGVVRQLGLVEGDVVGKKAAVGAQDPIDDLLELRVGIGEPVELVATHEEPETRGVVLLFYVIDITGTGQQPEGALDGHGEMPEIAAELGQVEGARHVEAVADGHLAVVAEVVVDGADEIAVGEGVGNATHQPAAIGRVVEKHSVGGLAVAAGTAGFLEIGFGGVGEVEMNDQTDIGLVDAHTEGIGGYHNTDGAGSPTLLALVFFGLGESGMVADGTVAPGREPGGQFAAALAAAGVDDDGTGETVEDVAELAFLVVGRADHIGKVGTVEGHAEDIRLTKGEATLDVVDHLGGGRGSQGEHGTVGEEPADVGNAGVGRTEVVAPLGNAVGFVDGEEADGDARQFLKKKGGGKALGRNVEKLVVAVDAVFEEDNDFFVGEATVDGGGLDAAAAQLGNLIFHEGYQRRDHQADSGTGEGGYLKSDGLAATRGHEAQGVASAADAGDDVVLDAAEAVVAPVVAEQLQITVVHTGKTDKLFAVGRADVLDLKLNFVALVGVLLDGVADVEGVFGLDETGLGTLAEGDAVHHVAALVVDELELDVLLFAADDFTGAVVEHVEGAEYGLGILGTEGVEALEVVVEFVGDVAEIEPAVDVDHGTGLLGQDVAGDVFLETAGEFLDVFDFHGKTGRIGVAPEILEQVAAAFDGLVDIETGHGTGRTGGETVGAGEYD